MLPSNHSFSNIAIAILDFSLLFLVKLSLLILFGISSLLLFWWLSLYSYRSFLKAIAKRLLLLFANAFKSVKERQLFCRNSWKSDDYMGSDTEKKPWNNLQNSYKNLSKGIKSDNFCYRKVGRAITKWGAIEKSPILLSQFWKNYHF